MVRRLAAIAVLIAACGGGVVSPGTVDVQTPAAAIDGLPACLADGLVGHSKNDVLACAGLPCGSVMTDGSDVERWAYCSNECKGECGTRVHVWFSSDGVVTETSP